MFCMRSDNWPAKIIYCVLATDKKLSGITLLLKYLLAVSCVFRATIVVSSSQILQQNKAFSQETFGLVKAGKAKMKLI